MASSRERGLRFGGHCRCDNDQKAKAREALVKSTTKALRQSGFNGIGVDSLAASAGVTSGAFYSNFSGKEELLGAVIDANLGEPFIEADSGTLAERHERLKSYLKRYISAQHCADPANGCVMPTLSEDVARSSDAVREAYRRRMQELVGKIARAIGREAGDADSRAWTIVALMVGAVSVARALPQGPQAQAILDAVLRQSIGLIDCAVSPEQSRPRKTKRPPAGGLPVTS
jgi:TetR/AcrR family transcriptional regulator, transcriptional repressor for nem operon